MKATLIRNFSETLPHEGWWLYLPEANIKLTAGKAETGYYYLLAIPLCHVQTFMGVELSLSVLLALTHERRAGRTVEVDDTIVAYAKEHALFYRDEYQDAAEVVGEAALERKSEAEIIDQFAIFDTRGYEARQREHGYAVTVADLIARATTHVP